MRWHTLSLCSVDEPVNFSILYRPLPSLPSLELSNNQLTDTTPLSALTGLTEYCLHFLRFLLSNLFSPPLIAVLYHDFASSLFVFLSPILTLAHNFVFVFVCLQHTHRFLFLPSSLARLWLYNNQMTDTTPLSALTELTEYCLHLRFFYYYNLVLC